MPRKNKTAAEQALHVLGVIAGKTSDGINEVIAKGDAATLLMLQPKLVADARRLLENVASDNMPKYLAHLPAINACDPWEMTTYTRRGIKKYVFTIACTERRENGYSNHAFAEVWVTRNLRLKVHWSHGQGHFYPTTVGSTKTFSDPRTMWGDAFRHIARYAKYDADIYVIS